VTKPFPIEPSSLKVDTYIESVEAQSDKWVSEDSNNYYYEIKNTENKL
jgi:hypothetical protein